jgi:hypothetical protein
MRFGMRLVLSLGGGHTEQLRAMAGIPPVRVDPSYMYRGKKKPRRNASPRLLEEAYRLVLCRFFLSFFFRLCVAIFFSFRFLPQGTSESPSQ